MHSHRNRAHRPKGKKGPFYYKEWRANQRMAYGSGAKKQETKAGNENRGRRGNLQQEDQEVKPREDVPRVRHADCASQPHPPYKDEASRRDQ